MISKDNFSAEHIREQSDGKYAIAPDSSSLPLTIYGNAV